VPKLSNDKETDMTSLRLASHQAKAAGASNAAVGLASALARAAAQNGKIDISARDIVAGMDAKTKAEVAAMIAPKVDAKAERAKARQGERERWAKVFGGKASHGRERLAVALLMRADNYPADNILNALAVSPTDAERAQQAEAKANPWGKVIGEMNARNGFK
jgi:hypothetical protein